MDIFTDLLNVIVWGAGLLSAALVLLPLHLRAAGGVEGDEIDGDVEIRWGWGIFTVRQALASGMEFFVFSFRIYRRPGRKERWKPRRRKEKKNAGPDPILLVSHRKTISNILHRIRKTIGLRARLHGVFGFDGPEYTALSALFLDQIGNHLPGVELDLRPDYLDSTMNLKASVYASIWPVVLLAIMAGLLFKQDTRRLLSDLRSKRR